MLAVGKIRRGLAPFIFLNIVMTPTFIMHLGRDITAQPAGQSIQTIASHIGYKPFGPMDVLTYGNGVSENRKYDLDYRLKNISDQGANPVQDLTNALDAANNITSITDGLTASNDQRFQYDNLNRLTSAFGGYGQLDYRYDHNGNRTSQITATDVTTYGYTPQSNRLTSISVHGGTQVLSYPPPRSGSEFTDLGVTN